MNYNFTFEKNREVNRKVEEDLLIIKKGLLNNLKDVSALILVGGFGRGEGSVILKKKVQILNDYDIVILTQNGLNRKQIKLLAQILIKRLKIRLIDLIPYQKDSLPLLPLTIFNYDLKYASYIFYGDKDILELMPKYNSGAIPLSEGKNLLFNRLICLTESFSEKYKSKNTKDIQTVFLVNQCAKAILAVSDAFLLLRNKYHPSYEFRARRFQKEYRKIKRLNKLVLEATKFKLLPQASVKVNNPQKFWLERKDIFLSNFLKFMNSYYKMKFLTIDEFIDYYLTINKPPLTEKLAVSLGISAESSDLLQARINCAQLFLLSAYEKGSINKNYVKKAQTLLDPHLDKSKGSLSWEQLRKANVKLWYKYFH